MLVVSLMEIGDGDAPSVGPKAAVLSRMLRAGLPVPTGFCVAGRAYREHLGRGDLLDRIRGVLRELDADPGSDPTPALEEIRRSIAATDVSTELREEMDRRWRTLGAPSAAVRSSATAEDLPERSFAGQYDSYLNVLDATACLDRVRDCWASLWSGRAFEYRRRIGIDHLKAEMAVIVQALVPAEAAGVMFTADPVSGRRDCVVIEAGFGLGPAIVAGKVIPDRLVISKRVFRVERRVTARKALEVVPGESGGVQERALGEARAGEPCLDDATASRLALLGSDLESLLGSPQDVEWAVAGGQVHLLQARPVTALPPEPARTWEDRQIWTNANLREAVPDVVTPMTWSGIRSLSGPLLDPVFGRLGIDVDPLQLAGVIAGRVYFNINTVVAIGKALHVRSRMDAGSIFGDGGQGSRAPAALRVPDEDLPRLRFRWHRLLLSLPGLLAWFLRNPLRRGPSILIRFQERITEEADIRWRGLGDQELTRRILGANLIVREGLLRDGRAPLVAIAGMAYYFLLAALCRRWFAGEGPGLLHRLLVGLGGMEDAEAGIELWKLAALAKRNPDVEAAVCEEDTVAGIELRRTRSAGIAPFLAALAEFLQTHGHHGAGEFEVANPRWAERPEIVLRLVRSHLAGIGHVDPVAQARRLAEARGHLERDCLRKLGNPIRRALFEAALRRAQAGLRFRETIKSQSIRYFALVRQMVLELGERLARRGIIDRIDDIFFLEMEELDPVAAGTLNPRATIAERRRDHERNVALAPPAIVFGRFDPRESAPEVVDGRGGELRGIGVSPGVAAGKARVVVHPNEDQVMPGEVLVAPCTDPSWAPCFLNAAAIVIDQGGLLSHGSIVAREYGIPCVVNVGPATRILHTGQQIEVDGDRGKVRIFEGDSTGDP